MRKVWIQVIPIIFSVLAIVLAVQFKEVVDTPQTEFTYSTYAREQAVTYGLDAIDLTRVFSSEEELQQTYLAGVRDEMSEFHYYYNDLVPGTDAQGLLDAIADDYTLVQQVSFDDRDKVTVGRSVNDYYKAIEGQPDAIVHKGYYILERDVWSKIMVGVMVVAGVIIVVNIYTILHVTGIIVPTSPKEIKSKFKKYHD